MNSIKAISFGAYLILLSMFRFPKIKLCIQLVINNFAKLLVFQMEFCWNPTFCFLIINFYSEIFYIFFYIFSLSVKKLNWKRDKRETYLCANFTTSLPKKIPFSFSSINILFIRKSRIEYHQRVWRVIFVDLFDSKIIAN